MVCSSLGPASLGFSELRGLPGSLFPLSDWGSPPSLFVQKLDEKMKPMLREAKESVQGTNSDGKETGTQTNGVDQKEERNIQPEKNEDTRIQKK